MTIAKIFYRFSARVAVRSEVSVGRQCSCKQTALKVWADWVEALAKGKNVVQLQRSA